MELVKLHISGTEMDLAITNATASSYTLTQDDVGAVITVTASYTDLGNTVESV